MARLVLGGILLIVLICLVEIEAGNGHRQKRQKEVQLTKSHNHKHKGFRNRNHKMSKKDILKAPKITFTEDMCDPPCKGKELCVLHYMATDSVCIHKKELKEARHLYRMAVRRNKFRKHHKKHGKGHKRNHHFKMMHRLSKLNRIHSNMKNPDYNGDVQFQRGSLKKLQRVHLKRNEHSMTLQNAEDLRELMTKGEYQPGDTSHMETKYPACKNKIEDMKKRLNGWFVELHQINKEKHDRLHSRRRNPIHFPEFHIMGNCNCAKSVMWNFHNMDKSRDHQLDKDERGHLEKAFRPSEKCVTPAVESCDADRDSVVTKQEWCCCFSNIAAPCYMHIKRQLRESDGNGYKPSCTAEGYYNKKQCNQKTGHCWCSDLDGNEIIGTRVKGDVTCEEEKGDIHPRRRLMNVKHVFP